MRIISKLVTSVCDTVHIKLARSFSLSSRFLQNQALPVPKSENEPEDVSPKIENLVNEISKLTLIEVSELSTALKKRLNIPDMPAMSFSGFAPPNISEEENEDTPAVAIKSNFNVKLVKFDDAKKVALIKEIKGLLSDMNLVQAKKFVESAPVIIKADLGKDEADKLKETLEKVGAECVVE